MQKSPIELNIDQWIEKATEDELTCQSILKHKDAPSGPVCFCAQQMAEKYLKALLIFHSQDFPKIHDLKRLATLLEPYVKNIFELEEKFNVLNKFYAVTRYPGDFPEGFSWKDAEEAFEAAIRIKEFVLEKIKAQKSGFGIVGIILVIAAVAILGGGYWYWQTSIETLPENPVVAESDFTGWKTYRNEKYGFEVKYPNGSWIIENMTPWGYWIDLMPSSQNRAETNFTVIGHDAKISIIIKECIDYDALPKNLESEKPRFPAAFGVERFSGPKIKDYSTGINKIFAFEQGCYECYEGTEQTDGFSALACASGKNERGNLAARCVTFYTELLKSSDILSLQKLRSFFIEEFLPTVRFNSVFNDVKGCAGKGEPIKG